MSSSQTILKNLKNLNQHLALFHPREPIHFEKLTAETFSHILYLPFYTNYNDNTDIPYRVTWQGSISPFSKAPPGPDVIAYCYNFYLIIEATLKTGANQWTQEFASSIRHCEDFCNQHGIQKKDVFILMICTKLSRDTYQSIKNHPQQEYKFIPIRVSDVIKILQTSILAFTIKHLEMRKLLHQIYRCIIDSSSLQDYYKTIDSLITGWQKDVLKSEKGAFLSIKSYEAMKKIERNNKTNIICISEILTLLQKHPLVGQYFNIVGEKFTIDDIEKNLIQQNLACYTGRSIQSDESIFEAVPFADFKGRSMRLIDAVMRIK